MDYKGQALAETLFTWIILIYSMIGWVYGYIQQDFSYVFYAWSAGVGLAIVLCVPDWPFYNRYVLHVLYA